MTSRPRPRFAALFFALLATLSVAAPVHAQEAAVADPDTRPAFSLSTSEVFTTRDAPNFYLTFRRVTQLDFRVYKVRDPFAFFGGLTDPHQFGTNEPGRCRRNVRWIERFADWKRDQRQDAAPSRAGAGQPRVPRQPARRQPTRSRSRSASR